MVRKSRWSLKDLVVRRLMDGLARSWRPEEFVKEAARPSDAAKQQTAKRPESSVKSEAKKKK